jgi:hypothetical protein
MQASVPQLLESLVACGRWPGTGEEARRQNLTSLVSLERVRSFAPEEERVFLHAPPFHTVAERVRRGEDFWNWATSRPEGLDQDQALVLGDFGLGSDAPIVLDFRTPPPRVLRLRWAARCDNRWVEVAPSFERFVELLGI